ncbi:hyaluronan-binding protein 2 [Callorhinchus milii]|nr:hyaluronan-binding protein 2 [Callorhinchus milii]|eukprot:gi/632974738/ref/XP_007903844.1/ PREDICTED: hyaluronan-binding protein 2-like [Callorhinchus milii]
MAALSARLSVSMCFVWLGIVLLSQVFAYASVVSATAIPDKATGRGKNPPDAVVLWTNYSYQEEKPRMALPLLQGKHAIPGSHPWQASIQMEIAGSRKIHACGATLIKPCWVITAAHCVNDSAQTSSLKIQLGKNNLYRKEPSTEQVLDVGQIIIHQAFRKVNDSLYNDIALIKLNGTCATETKFVKTLPLAEEAFPPGMACQISGWGKTELGIYSYRRLLEGTVKLINRTTCMEPQVYGDHLDDKMMCAGDLSGTSADACQGDSGGPLTCERNGQRYLYGIISWGRSCGKVNKPGVYIIIPKYLDWIRAHMQ